MKTIKPTRGPSATKKIFNDIVDDLKELEKTNGAQDLEITKLKVGTGSTIVISGNLNGAPGTARITGRIL